MQKRNLATAVGQLENHLLWLKEEGARTIAADPKILSTVPAAPAPVSSRALRDGQPKAANAWKTDTPKVLTAVASAKAVPSLGKNTTSAFQSLEKPAAPAPVAGPEAAAAQAKLKAIAQRVAGCQQCVLGKTRKNTVPGQGTPQPEIMFVGEGPGEDEDLQGLAFVGRAGQLLTRMIIRMGLTRDQVFIANIVKCRPPNNRAPLPDEAAACLPYLREQVAILKPKVIVCLGASAVKGLLNNQTGITKLRGQWQKYEGVDVMPTFHPSFLLRGGGEDKARWWEVWEDLVAVLKKVGREAPPQKTSAPS